MTLDTTELATAIRRVGRRSTYPAIRPLLATNPDSSRTFPAEDSHSLFILLERSLKRETPPLGRNITILNQHIEPPFFLTMADAIGEAAEANDWEPTADDPPLVDELAANMHVSLIGLTREIQDAHDLPHSMRNGDLGIITSRVDYSQDQWEVRMSTGSQAGYSWYIPEFLLEPAP